MYINNDKWIQLFLFALFALIFLQQSWANLVQRKISMLSIDRLVIFLSENFANHKNKIETRRLSKNPKRLTIQGLIALLAFLGFLRLIFEWIDKHF